ncbi:MAG: aspartate kinase [Parcubacteria group bacterium]|nr:aspartate kinase [Parcubacteria group bacterium]
MLVSKFGGTSLADADQIKKVIAIVQSNPERQYIVVSAPGKRHAGDQKITDLFKEWHRHQELKLSLTEIRRIISARYIGIMRGLELGSKLQSDLTQELDEIQDKIAGGASIDYAMSRGEYLSGKIMAVALGYDFVDPATCVYFDEHGKFLNDYRVLCEALQGRRVAVIPGFYGSKPDGSIKTFSRGGSDITGAIVARAVGAETYENWTDVSGLLMADPRVVDNPRTIREVTRRELRELSYMGASVFHEEAMFPMFGTSIVTNIRNTNNPDDEGTYIVADGDRQANAGVITGVAGRKNFTVITVEKQMMNQEVGFVRRILTALEANGISFEHVPSGIDTLSVIIGDDQLDGKLQTVLDEIRQSCQPDTIEAYPNMAMIAIVGRAMVHVPGTAARVFTALANAGINIRMMNQGSSEISIIIGVENDDYENAVRAIYGAFVW